MVVHHEDQRCEAQSNLASDAGLGEMFCVDELSCFSIDLFGSFSML